MSPTQRSLKLYRDLGFRVAIVEHWNPFAKIRQDMFGFCDLFCFHPKAEKVICVQATSMGNLQARVKKLEALTTFHEWIADPMRQVHVIGWAKQGARGEKKRWVYKILKPVIDIQHITPLHWEEIQERDV